MITEAVNIIEVHAVPGQGFRLRAPLSSMVDSLRNASGCISYSAAQSSENSDLWIISGYWKSISAMVSHYNHPDLNDLSELVDCQAVNLITVRSFTAAGT